MVNKTAFAYFLLFFIFISCIFVVRLGVEKKKTIDAERETQKLNIYSLEMKGVALKQQVEETKATATNLQKDVIARSADVEMLKGSINDYYYNVSLAIDSQIKNEVGQYSPYANDCLLVTDNKTVQINCKKG